MLIREVMHPDPITVKPSTRLKEAYKIMQDNNIRHLPVMDHKKLVGIVTDRDLRLATSKLTLHPYDVKTEVGILMSHPVQFTHPSDPVEIATRTMRELKIGCLPVIEDAKLVGIVTGMDLLDALLLLTGIYQPSGRLDVRLNDRVGELARLTALLAEHKINVHSILSYREKNRKIRIVLRVGTIEMKLLAEAICNAGFEVIWPVHIACIK